MDDLPEYEELPIKGGGSTSFVSYMFTLSSTEKNEITNALQYILLAIIPIVLLLKILKTYIPLENPEKGSIEITVEVALQLFIIFIAFMFIHKLIVFIPTYSTVPYGKMNLVQIILPVIFLLLCMKSSISEKLSILLERTLVATGFSSREHMTVEKKEDKPNKVQNSMPPMDLPFPESSTQVPNPRPSKNYNEGFNNQKRDQHQQFGITEPYAANEIGNLNNY